MVQDLYIYIFCVRSIALIYHVRSVVGLSERKQNVISPAGHSKILKINEQNRMNELRLMIFR